MFTKITSSSATNAFFEGYRYEPISGHRLRATVIEIADEVDELRLVFPDSVPLDENGRPFAPGCDCVELQTCHAICGELQLPTRHVSDISMHTGVFRHNENDEPEFEFLAPDAGASDAMIVVTWDGQRTPPMKGLTCSFARKFHAKYFARVEPEKDELATELTTFGIDLWVIPKNAILTEAFREAERGIREQIAAGDVFAATAEQVKPRYREYMEDTLYPAILARGSDYLAEFGDDQADLFLVHKEVDNDGKVTVCGRTQIGRFQYTLKDAQRFAMCTSHHVTTTPHNSARTGNVALSALVPPETAD